MSRPWIWFLRQKFLECCRNPYSATHPDNIESFFKISPNLLKRQTEQAPQSFSRLNQNPQLEFFLYFCLSTQYSSPEMWRGRVILFPFFYLTSRTITISNGGFFLVIEWAFAQICSWDGPCLGSGKKILIGCKAKIHIFWYYERFGITFVGLPKIIWSAY